MVTPRFKRSGTNPNPKSLPRGLCLNHRFSVIDESFHNATSSHYAHYEYKCLQIFHYKVHPFDSASSVSITFEQTIYGNPFTVLRIENCLIIEHFHTKFHCVFCHNSPQAKLLLELSCGSLFTNFILKLSLIHR